MRRVKSCVAFKPVVLAILLAFPAQQALAATCDWNATSGNWNAVVNWISCTAGNGNPAPCESHLSRMVSDELTG